MNCLYRYLRIYLLLKKKCRTKTWFNIPFILCWLEMVNKDFLCYTFEHGWCIGRFQHYVMLISSENCHYVCPWGRVSLVTITHDALDLTIQASPCPGPCSVQAPPGPSLPDTFKGIPFGPHCTETPRHYEGRVVGKQAVGILLKCFLVGNAFYSPTQVNNWTLGDFLWPWQEDTHRVQCIFGYKQIS